MKSILQNRSSAPVWWLFHALVIAGMCLGGVFLGERLVETVMQPVVPGDLVEEWWQIFRKFAATMTGGIFIAVLLGYVLLIWPEQ